MAVDSFLNMYKLMLGDFDVSETFGNGVQSATIFLWALFVFATLLTQVIYSNQLIAIVSDSYAKVMAQGKRYALQQETNLIADYVYLCKVDKAFGKN